MTFLIALITQGRQWLKKVFKYLSILWTLCTHSNVNFKDAHIVLLFNFQVSPNFDRMYDSIKQSFIAKGTQGHSTIKYLKHSARWHWHLASLLYVWELVNDHDTGQRSKLKSGNSYRKWLCRFRAFLACWKLATSHQQKIVGFLISNYCLMRRVSNEWTVNKWRWKSWRSREWESKYAKSDKRSAPGTLCMKHLFTSVSTLNWISLQTKSI